MQYALLHFERFPPNIVCHPSIRKFILFTYCKSSKSSVVCYSEQEKSVSCLFGVRIFDFLSLPAKLPLSSLLSSARCLAGSSLSLPLSFTFLSAYLASCLSAVLWLSWRGSSQRTSHPTPPLAVLYYSMSCSPFKCQLD